MTTIVGTIATLLSISIAIPQAIKAWRLRHNHKALQGISVLSMLALLANALAWFLYAILQGDIFIGMPGLVNIPVALFTLFFVVRARRVKPDLSHS